MTYAGMFLMLFGASSFFWMQSADPFVAPKFAPIIAGILIVALSIPWRNRRLFGSSLTPALGLFAFVMMVCTVRSSDLWTSLIGERMGQFCSVLAFMTCIAGLYAANYASQVIGYEVVPELALWAAIPALLYGLMQAFDLDPIKRWTLPEGHRIGSTMGSPLYLGALLVVLIPVAAHLARKSVLGRFCLGAGLLCLYFTGTRAAMLAGGVGLLVYITLSGMIRLRHWIMWVIVAAVGAAAVGSNLISWKPSDVMRIEIWRAAWRIFQAHPWLGYGPDTFALIFRSHITPRFMIAAESPLVSQFHAHNDVLQIASTMGLAGLLAYACVLIAAGRAIARVYAHQYLHEHAAMVAGAAVGLFFVAKFNAVPLGALFLMAVLFGNLPDFSPSQSARTPLIALSLSAVGLGIAVMPILKAEHSMYRGYMALEKHQPLEAAQSFIDAHEAAPAEMFYASRAIDGLTMVLPFSDVAAVSSIATAARGISAEAIRRHPSDSFAYQAAGTALMMGQPEIPAALSAFDRAQTLAPTFEPLMRQRLALAWRLGLQDEIKHADLDLFHIEKTLSRRS